MIIDQVPYLGNGCLKIILSSTPKNVSCEPSHHRTVNLQRLSHHRIVLSGRKNFLAANKSIKWPLESNSSFNEMIIKMSEKHSMWHRKWKLFVQITSFLSLLLSIKFRIFCGLTFFNALKPGFWNTIWQTYSTWT